MLAALELVQRRRRRALVAHEAVRVVLEHRHAALRRELDDALAARGRKRPSARVLEGRDRVDEARLPGVERLRQRVGVEPLVVHRHRHGLGSEAGEDLQRPVVRRRLDEDAAWAFRQQLLRVEDEALKAAVGDDDARRLDSMPRAEPLPQRPVAAAGAVREHRRVAFDRSAGAIGEQLRVEALGRRRASAQRKSCESP